MIKNIVVLSVLFLFSLSGLPSPVTGEILQPKEINSKIGALKIPFIKNEPHTKDTRVKYYANITAGNVFVEDDAVTYSLIERTGPGGWTVREKLLGLKETRVEGVKPSPTKVNIFKGNEKKNWQSNIPTYEALSFGEIYDHIRLNLKAYGSNMEKIFVVENGGDPKNIALCIEGAKTLKVNPEGELEIETGIGTLKMTTPLAFQEIDGKKVKVAAAYELKASAFQETDPRHIYGFKVGEYDKTKQLIIDPLLAWTFLGGTQEDKAYAIALDSEGNVFVTGTTRSTDFYTNGAVVISEGNLANIDIFVAKLDANLQNLSIITFIGGIGDDYANCIAINPQTKDIYVAGYTFSGDFPTTPPSGSFGGVDGFVIKLDTDLSLVTSVRIGGTSADYTNSIGVDSTGNVYVAGYTSSATLNTSSGAFPSSLTSGILGEIEAFVSKFDSYLSPIAVNLIGGDGSDYAYSMAIHQGSGDIYITGATSTSSANFPLILGSFGPGGNLDVFIARLNSNLTHIASAYLGGNDHDVAKAIAVSPEGHVYVTGWTASTAYYIPPTKTTLVPPTFPRTAGAYDKSDDPLKVPVDRNADVFVSKFNSYLSILLASTLLGGADGEEATGIAIDSYGNVFVTGWTASEGDPSATPAIPPFPTAQGAYDSTLNGEEDAFVVQFDPNLTTLLSSTILGGESHDIAQGIALDPEVNVYVAGSTYSCDFPRVPREIASFLPVPYGDHCNGSWDAFITKFSPDFLSQYSLTIETGGTGEGTVTSLPTGIHYDTACKEVPPPTECQNNNVFNYGLKVKLTATPKDNSVFDQTSWTGGCIVEDLAKPWECTVTMLTDTVVGLQFILKTYTIQTTVDPVAGGTILPTAPVVQYGKDQDFVITPNAGYALVDLLVDGVGVSQPNPFEPKYEPYPYKLRSVTADRTIQAVFRPNPVIQAALNEEGTICAICGGTISPIGTVTVQYGANQIFSITPDAGNYLAEVRVDGTSVVPAPPKYGTYIYNFTNVTSDRTIRAIFRPNPVIQTTADPGGAILPVGPVTLQYGASQSFSMTPNEGFALADLLVDGVSVLSTPQYTTYTYNFTNVIIDHTIRAVFRPNPVIQTSANAGGTISPVGPVTIQYGANQSFSITPGAGNYLADVIVDGVSVVPAPPKYGTYTYTFTNVTSDRSIRAVFQPNPVIQTVADPGGTILPVGPVTLQYGASQSFSMTPNEGFALADLLVDGVSVLSTPQYTTYTYNFTNVIIDHTIRAVFRPNPVIQTSANAGGTISPVGPVTIQYGANQSFSITPGAGNYLADVIVDGNSLVPAPPKYGTYIYTFTNVTSDRAIRAVFRPNPVIQTTADTGGTISPVGPMTVQYGASQSFSITPAAGNYLADVIVDGNSLVPTPPKYGTYIYTFTNVTTDRTIRAVFRPNPVIQTTADTGGTISPVGPMTVQYGASQSFSITPAAGNYLADVIVDGNSLVPTPPKYGTYIYTFTNVTTDRTIRAVFRPNPVIQTTADPGGTILPVGPVTVQYGASQSFSMTPNAGFALADLLVDGVSVLSTPQYTTYTYNFTNVIIDHTIRAVFRPNPVIQTSANAGGTISPVGPVTIQYGANQSFSITPGAGNYLADVIVDGNSLVPAPPKYGTYIYTFTNVTSDRAIRAVFRPNPVIQTTADTGGTISPVGPMTVQYGASQSFSITPAAGNYLADVIVDGNSLVPTPPKYGTYIYTFTNVTTDRTIRAVFRPNPVIQTTADTGGTISPVGPMTVQYGASQSFSITPAAGNYLADVIVDGNSLVPTPPKYGTYIYTFTNVTTDRTIRAVFRPNPVIQTTADPGGTILPVGPVTVQYGASQSFSMTPNAGFALADLLVDGVSVLSTPQYTTYTYNFTNVIIDHTIRALFRPNPVIQTSANAGGTISPLGPVTVQYGGNQSFSITPDAGNYLADVIVDGNSLVPSPPKYGTYIYTFTNVTSDRSIRVVFYPNPMIQTTADPGGTILPVGPVTVQYGASQSFSITPDSGYALADLLVDGVSVLTEPKYGTYIHTLTNVTSDRTIRAIFRSNPVILTTPNTGGTISPVGPVTVQYGASQSFSITPGSGYYLAEVSVDGNSVTPAPPKYGAYIYTFTNVTSDRSIRVVFYPNPMIQTTADPGGTILPVGPVTVQYGANQSFSITPDSGYALTDLLVDGVSVLTEPKYGTYIYTLTNVTSDRTIRAVFRPNPVIQTAVNAGGTISPVGPVTVQYGASQSFSITPGSGYYLADVIVDGNSVVPAPPKYGVYTYTFTNVTSGRTIRAVFYPNPMIQTTVDPGGTIFPAGSVSVRYGENITFSITPDEDYSVFDVIVDGISKGPITSWTFTNVTSDRSIRAVFRPGPVIQTIADTGGSIFPPGPVTVSYGGGQSFTIIPDAGYYIFDVMVNGVSVGAVSTYTFTNVTSDQTIRATFRHHPVIDASASAGGTISPQGTITVTYGGSQSFSITPSLGSYLVDVIVDGNSVIPPHPHYGTYTYTFTNVTSDRTILAVFQSDPTIEINQSTGGTIFPDTTLTVRYGSDLLISVVPDTGYFVADVIIDGFSIGPFAGYLLTDITEDHSVRAIFTQTIPTTPYTIIATATPGGVIKPFGIQKVKALKSKSFTIKASKGYHIKDVIVDGLSKGPVPTYSFKLVAASHTIEAVFDTKKTLNVVLGGTGNGTVVSRPGGISCGKDCTQSYKTEDLIQLIPKPSKDSVFTGWSGGGCKGTDTCMVTMTDDLTVFATFSLK